MIEKIKYSITEFIRLHYLFNRGKFKEGDIVKYNWMAKVQLGDTYNENLRIVKNIVKCDGDLIYFMDGDAANAHWLKKVK